jgi:CRP-like cAMP-binding protein
MSEQVQRALRGLVGGLQPEDLEGLVGLTELRRFPPGFAVFHEGLAPADMALLLEGRLRISKLRPDKRQESIAYVEPVALLGHAPLLGGFRHPTTAMSCEPSLCLMLPGKLLTQRRGPRQRRLALALLQAALRAMNAQLRTANARLYGLAGERELMESMAADLGAWSLPSLP